MKEKFCYLFHFYLCHLFLSSLHLSSRSRHLYHLHSKCLQGVGVIPQCRSEKTWHAFRAQLPNASHYYCGSSAITPWGKGPQNPHSISLPLWVMDLWYPPSPYGANGQIYIENTHTPSEHFTSLQPFAHNSLSFSNKPILKHTGISLCRPMQRVFNTEHERLKTDGERERQISRRH